MKTTDPRIGHAYPPFERLYVSALRDVADPRLTYSEREAAARLVAFLLHEKAATEAVATDVLSAAERAFDTPMAVLTLMLGLRDTVGDHARLAAGATRLANVALKEQRREAFLVLVHVLVGLGFWGGDIPAPWRTAFVRAHNDRLLRDRIGQTSDAYSRRFGRSFFAEGRLVLESKLEGAR